MADFNYPPNDPDTLDPLDFTVDAWTDPNGSEWLYVASPGYWAASVTASGGGDLTSGPVTSSGGVSAIADGALSAAKTAGTAVTLSGNQTISGVKTFSASGFAMKDESDTFTRAVTGNDVTLIYGGIPLAQGDENGRVALTTGVTGTLPIANGGTGGATASDARTELGAGATGAGLFQAATALAALQLLNIKTYIRTTDATARTTAVFATDDTLASMPVTSGKSYLFIVSIRYTSTTVGMQWKLVTPGHDGGINAVGISVNDGGGVANLYDGGGSTDILVAASSTPRTARRWFALGLFKATATGNCAIHWSPNTTGGSAQFLTGSQCTMFELPG